MRLQESKLDKVNEKINKLEKDLSDNRNENKTLKEENKRLKAKVNENSSQSSSKITKPFSIGHRPTGWLERRRQHSNFTRINTVNESEVAKDLDEMQIENKPEPTPARMSLGMYKLRRFQQISVENKSCEGDKMSVSSMRIGVGGLVDRSLNESEDEPLSLGRRRKIVKK